MSMKKNNTDIQILQERFLDAEHKGQLLEEELHRIQRDSKDKEGVFSTKIANLQEDLKMMEVQLEAKHQQLLSTDAELFRTRDALEGKIREASSLNSDVQSRDCMILQLTNEKDEALRNLAIEGQAHRATQEELGRTQDSAERLREELEISLSKEKDASRDNYELQQVNAKMVSQIKLLQKELSTKGKELELMTETRKAGQRDLEKLTQQYNKLMEETRRLAGAHKDLELEYGKIRQSMNDNLEVVEAKQREICNIQSSFAQLKEKSKRMELEMGRLEGENRRLRTPTKPDQSYIPRIADYGARQDSIYRTMESYSSPLRPAETDRDVKKELETLRQHTQLLESQNKSLQNELDRFAYTNEKVRKDLHLKPEVDTIKTLQKEALDNSFEKVKNASPQKYSSSRFGSTSKKFSQNSHLLYLKKDARVFSNI